MLSGRVLPALPDSKHLNRALFGLIYEEDIYDVCCGLAPRLMRAFSWRIDPQMQKKNLIFVHVPRVAGTSISSALFGPRNTLHHSIRYYRTVNPRFYRNAQSFAVLRDPFARFASSYLFVRAGGTASCRLSALFVAETRHIASLDDYLDYLETRDVLALDFVMRPQSWFVCDLATSQPLVKNLFLLERDQAALGQFLRCYGVEQVPQLNPSRDVPLFLSARQKQRVENIYASDFLLVESLLRSRAREVWNLARIADIAAE